MSSLCTPCCMQHKLQKKTPIDRHADVLGTNRSPWFCRNPSTSHLHKQKLHSPNDKLTKKILIAKQGTLHKTLKIVCVSFVCFVWFVSFRLKIEIPHDCIKTLKMCQSPTARIQAALSIYFSHAYHYCQEPYRLYLLNLSHSNGSQVFQPCNDL